MKKLTDAIHEAGCLDGVRLWLGGSAVLFGDSTAMVVLPIDFKAAPNYVIPGTSIETIKESILSKAFNKRTNEYGGFFENRSRFLLESIEYIRNNIPEDMPLFMRIDAFDDYLEYGLTIEDVILL